MSVASQVVNITGALSIPVDYRDVLQKSDSECGQKSQGQLNKAIYTFGLYNCLGGRLSVQSEHNNWQGKY